MASLVPAACVLAAMMVQPRTCPAAPKASPQPNPEIVGNAGAWGTNVLNADGSNITLIADCCAGIPNWLPGGNGGIEPYRVFFNKGSGVQIRQIAVENSLVRVLSSVDVPVNRRADYVWAKPGSTNTDSVIAVLASEGYGYSGSSSSSAFTFDANTGVILDTIYTAPPGRLVYSAAWNPDGTRIIVVDRLRASDLIAGWDARLKVVDVASHAVVVELILPTAFNDVREVDWSPQRDGANIVAFGAMMKIKNQTIRNVYLLAIDPALSDPATPLTPAKIGEGTCPAFTADGAAVLFGGAGLRKYTLPAVTTTVSGTPFGCARSRR